MALLKYLLPYAICTVALMYFQSDFVFAANECICCSKDDKLINTTSYCDENELDSKANVTHCKTPTTTDNCGGVSYVYGNISNVHRGFNINCTFFDNMSKNYTNVVCKSCTDDNCNTFDLVHKSSSNQIGYSVIPLLLSIVLAMYPN